MTCVVMAVEKIFGVQKDCFFSGESLKVCVLLALCQFCYPTCLCRTVEGCLKKSELYFSFL